LINKRSSQQHPPNVRDEDNDEIAFWSGSTFLNSLSASDVNSRRGGCSASYRQNH